MKTSTQLVQTQTQRQTQTTSATQVLLSNVMEMPLADLENYVSNEVESNEALERTVDDTESSDGYADEMHPGDEFGVRDSHMTEDDYGETLTIDEVPEDHRERYNQEMSTGNGRAQYDGDTERQTADTSATSYDALLAQIGEQDLTEEEETVLQYLVGSLDERGYLAKDSQTICDELTFGESIFMEPDELDRLIHILQSFEPRGIGARDLRECLLLQLEVPAKERAQLPLVKRLAHKVIRDMYDDMLNGHWRRIQDELDVTDDTVKEIQQTIRHLNFRPGSMLNESIQSAAPTIIPDFYLTVEVDDEDEANSKIFVSQKRGIDTELRVSNSFVATVDEYRAAQERARSKGQELKTSRQKQEDYIYALEKVESAKAFIEILRRRRHTLQSVMETIAHRQRAFFLNQDDETLLVPMVMRDIAETVDVDISTVSRAVNSKYVATDYGTYSLKYFFGSEFTTADGDSVSQRHAMNAIREIIENEDPRQPLSDEKIASMLAEDGLSIARRTVAKYRDRLGYPTSSRRRG